MIVTHKQAHTIKKLLYKIKQSSQLEIQKQINGETERNGVWFPEDGDSCYKTGWIDRSHII